jgi:hypothetical protein
MSRRVSKVNTASRVGVYPGRIVVLSRAVNPLAQPVTVGKHIDRRSPRVSWRGLGLTLVLACILAVALCALAAGAFAAEGGGGCPNEALRAELNSSLLPECRAYEMVTPPYKEGHPLSANSYAADGESAMLTSLGAIAGTPGSGESATETNVYLDTRTAGGWRLSPMNAPSSEFVGELPYAWEADDGMSLWVMHTPRQSAKTRELYVRSAEGDYVRVGTLSPKIVSDEESDTIEAEREPNTPVAATSTYQHVVVRTSTSLSEGSGWPFDKTTGEPSLYEYSGVNNERPVLVAATGEKPTGGEYHEQLLAECGSVLGSGEGFYNALSSDGESIFFTLEPCAGKPAEVYARLHGSMISPAPAESVAIGEPECSEECEVESGKNFEGASENGERVFFTSTQKLTSDASNLTGGGSATQQGCPEIENGCNLYEYSFALPVHERLRLVAGGVADMRGVAGIAEDGTRVYFVAKGEIAGSGKNEFGHEPELGQPNLYMYDTETSGTTFIATLSEEDERDWLREFTRRPIEVTGDGGRFLLFVSKAPNVTSDETSNGLAQLFEYDAETRELVRVTQGEEGYDNDGNSVTAGINGAEGVAAYARALGGNADFKSTTNRLNISRNGKTVVFETAGELSPRAAASASVGCTSVYEFHSEGSVSEGAVHLISDGRDVQRQGFRCGSRLLAMDEEGQNVLIEEADPLLTSDVDGVQRDIYDARIGGGFAPGPLAAGQCEGEGCQGVVSGPPGPTVPGSLGQAPEASVAPAVTPPAPTVKKKTTVKCAKGVRHEKQCKKKAQTKRGSARKKSAHRKGSGRS